MPLMPAQPAPSLKIPLVGGGTFDLADAKPEAFTMIVVYRGYHCPICKSYTGDLSARLEDFAKQGVDVVTVSMDDQDRAEKAMREWELGNLTVGYGMSEETARAWGLYVSESISEAERARFPEPGVFLIKPDGNLYAAWVQTTPFARPSIEDLLGAVEFVQKKEYPPRGTLAA